MIPKARPWRRQLRHLKSADGGDINQAPRRLPTPGEGFEHNSIGLWTGPVTTKLRSFTSSGDLSSCMRARRLCVRRRASRGVAPIPPLLAACGWDSRAANVGLRWSGSAPSSRRSRALSVWVPDAEFGHGGTRRFRWPYGSVSDSSRFATGRKTSNEAPSPAVSTSIEWTAFRSSVSQRGTLAGAVHPALASGPQSTFRMCTSSGSRSNSSGSGWAMGSKPRPW